MHPLYFGLILFIFIARHSISIPCTLPFEPNCGCHVGLHSNQNSFAQKYRYSRLLSGVITPMRERLTSRLHWSNSSSLTGSNRICGCKQNRGMHQRSTIMHDTALSKSILEVTRSTRFRTNNVPDRLQIGAPSLYQDDIGRW